MTDCEFGSQLSAYHDGELSQAVASVLEQHLPACVPCIETLGTLRELSGIVSDLIACPALSSLDIKLHASTLSLLHVEVDRWGSERNDSRLLRFSRVLVAMAACLLVGAGVWVFGLSHSASIPTVAVHATPWEQAAVTLQTEIATTGGIDLATDWVVADATLPAAVE